MISDNLDVSRRTVTRAAWGLPAVATVAASPRLAASHVDGTVHNRLTYRVFGCVNGDPVPIVGVEPPYAVPPGAVELGVWTLYVSTSSMVSIPPNTTWPGAAVRLRADLTGHLKVLLWSSDATSDDDPGGTMSLCYRLEGSVVSPGQRVAPLSLDVTLQDGEGRSIAFGDGWLPAETSTTPGTITRNYDRFTANLVSASGGSIQTIGVSAALEPAGQNTDFLDIRVV